MYGGVVENIVPAVYTKEARTLRIGLFSQLGHFEKLFSRSKFSVFFTERNDIFRHGGI